MIEFIWLNGTAVRVTSFREYGNPEADGAARPGYEVVFIVRGARADADLAALLAAKPLELAMPAPDGDQAARVDVVEVTRAKVGVGDGATFRYQVQFRERQPDDPIPEPLDEVARLRLRLEALIDALVNAGVIERAALDAAARGPAGDSDLEKHQRPRD